MLTPALSNQGSYRGRFAPSPSGPLHFGSLIAALASFLAAKSQQGQWLVRIEDIDTPRVVKGADSDILRTLEAYGLHWDETVVYQSQRHALYHEALALLEQQSLVYACQCTRKDIKLRGGLYDNHCRSLNQPFAGNALRLQQNFPVETFNDQIQGQVHIPNKIAHEDYIVKRRDGLFAYQLVVVLDDIEQNITHVVRGADLLEPTARQLGLFQQLGYVAPQYAHVPLAVAKPGFKLSKQNHAPAIDKHNPKPATLAALRFLGFNPPRELDDANTEEILTWATQSFSLNTIPKVLEKPINNDL
ncbi:tRNA glutamyl-Q(34) synthetase GluQRS [Pseudoalteromonas sp. S16_S37]|uniref:tRNA glutamyl-Q(34) synthetase GluQRS n=1 Tax=Pseudoalteromonas sp. S16_S37 TaxID=2720228 RepID=UPI001680FFDB|nr:tRNA glutamyl-Q(34) synthetase GluQRS [Pseudoalteromonas sp. S16_S37]MBD1581723.1 tRNA glutamyl-Q(34) synthetase GluQRS [Pseudoalteromonas sp. S16_S37]